jgi:hypothetical protein
LSPDEKDTLLKNEVEKRLDDLFGEDEGTAYPEKQENVPEDEEFEDYQDTLEFSEVEEYEDTQEMDPDIEADEEDGAPTKLEEDYKESLTPDEIEGEMEDSFIADEIEGEMEDSFIADEIEGDTEESFIADETEEKIEEEESFIPDEILEESALKKPPRFSELEAIILSIDWEINDETMSNLRDQVELLKVDYKDDKVVVMFLRLLGSVGKYIKNNKANAHPGSIKLLNSVYQNLEKVVLDDKLAESMREKLLLGEVETFKKLKNEIAIRKAEIRKRKSAEIKEAEAPEKHEEVVQVEEEVEPAREPAGEEVIPGPGRLSPHEAFYFAVEEIKGIIQAEFKALRAELKLWRESQ